MPELDVISLIDELRSLPAETEWVEFKSNYQTSERMGEYISALANSACLHQMNEAYLIFGIENETHKVIGTTFDYRNTKGKGEESLEPWLLRNLHPNAEFKIEEVMHPKGRLIIFFIQPASSGPVKFLDKNVLELAAVKNV